MRYYEQNPEENSFHTLLADITHKCNMNCENCYIPNRSIPDMDEERFCNFLERLPRRTDIRLIGAEPTMHPRLLEFIRHIRSRGHRATLLTNGLKMSDEDFARKIFENGVKSLGISLNGGTDDNVYREIDNLPTGEKKIRALDNCIKIGFVTHINCILVRGVNEHVPGQILDLVKKYLRKYQRKSGRQYPIMLRFKSVGKIGRYLEVESFDLKELIEVVSASLGISRKSLNIKSNVDGFSECHSVIFSTLTDVGEIFFKLTDWSVDEDGVPDSGSRRRGRITEDFMVAPFFEHVKLNENGY